MKCIVGTLGKLLPIILLGFIFSACNKEHESPSEPFAADVGRIELRVQYFVDDNPLVMDTIKYMNGAGYVYSITKLHYYLDSFQLISNDKTIQAKGTFWMDASKASSIILLENIPQGKYTGIKFLIGLRPGLNIPNGLPITEENLSMVWPETMGGGYHFVMMEGHYEDNAYNINGYTFHLGTNSQRIEHNTIPITLKIADKQTSSLTLAMQINEWFVHPYTYDFAISGNHIMGIDSSMQKIRDNGKDVFRSL